MAPLYSIYRDGMGLCIHIPLLSLSSLTHAGHPSPLAVLLPHIRPPGRRGVDGRVGPAWGGVAGGAVTEGGWNRTQLVRAGATVADIIF